MIYLLEELLHHAVSIPGLENPHILRSNSKVCFETLMRLYYLRHGFEASDTHILRCLVTLSLMSMAELKALTSSSTTSSLAAIDDVRATLILAAKGLHDQGRGYYVSQILYRTTENQMSAEDAKLMWKFVGVRKEESEAEQLRANHVKSQFPVNIVKITDDPETQWLSDMMKKFSEIARESMTVSESSETESDS